MIVRNNTLLYLSILLLLIAHSSMAAEGSSDVSRTIQLKPEHAAFPTTTENRILPLPIKSTFDPFRARADVVDRTEEETFSIAVPLRGEELNLRSVQKAFDTASPTATIKTYEYDQNRRYDVRLRVYTGTLIKLPEDEEIKAMALGDIVNFAVTPFSKDTPNLAYVQVINAAGVDTTLTLIGKSKRIYNFYLRGDAVNSSRVPVQMVRINAPVAAQIKSFQFEEAEGIEIDRTEREPYVARAAQKQADYLKTIAASRGINTHYKIYGSKSTAGIAPYAVYDDGHFTYFDYRDSYGELPVLFRVNDGIDSRNNTDKKDGFLIAQGVSQEGWTLKHGDKVICIRPTLNIRDYWEKHASSPIKPTAVIAKNNLEEPPTQTSVTTHLEYSYPSERK